MVKFDYAAGVIIQQEQLAAWRCVLNDRAFAELSKYCQDSNQEVRAKFRNPTGYVVARGTDLDNFVANLANRWNAEQQEKQPQEV